MTTSSDHNGHRQTSSQKDLQNPVNIVQNPLFIWDPIYIYINIFINNFNLTQLSSRRHVLIPGNVSVLSRGTVILQIMGHY